MVSADYIRLLYRYTDWANARMLAFTKPLAREQFERDLGSSFPSVRATLVHMLSSEWIWLERWQGRGPSGLPGADELDRHDRVGARWNDLKGKRDAFLERVNPDMLRKTITYRNSSGSAFDQPLWEPMCHAANHATYHRGQVTTMVRQLGEIPMATDLIAFFRSDAYDRGA